MARRYTHTALIHLPKAMDCTDAGYLNGLFVLEGERQAVEQGRVPDPNVQATVQWPTHDPASSVVVVRVPILPLTSEAAA